jgi:hypothetical protein
MSIHRNLNVKITAKIADILTHLQEHKAEHAIDYHKAVHVYFQDTKTKLTELLGKAEEGNLKVSYSLHMQPPINNERLYDKYIGMFTMHQGDTMEIDSETYGCLVDNAWDWAVQASTVNSLYSSKF